MPTRLRGLLAALPVLIALALVPSASATCGTIDAFVQNGKIWYAPTDAPPSVVFDVADDERSPKDFLNETTAIWLSASPTGPFGFTTIPAWDTYAPGVNNMRMQLHCASGMQTIRTVVRYDPIAPAVSWSLPGAGQWLRGTVPLQATGTDTLSGVTSYAFTVPTGTTTSSDGNATFDTTAAADGRLVLSAVSLDYVGNRSAPSTRVVWIDNGAPTVSIDAAASAFVATPTVNLAASASDAQSGVGQVRFEGRTSSAAAWQALGSDADAPYRLTIATPAVEGDYEVRAVATDAIGNAAASAGSLRTIDRVAPAAALNTVPATVSGTASLSAVASDGGSGVAHVEFQAAPSGTDDWQTLATDDAAPFTARVATPGAVGRGLRTARHGAGCGREPDALRTALDGRAQRRSLDRRAVAVGRRRRCRGRRQRLPRPSMPPSARSRSARGRCRTASRAATRSSCRAVPRGSPAGVVVVTLQNARRPTLIQRVRAITTASGSFRASFVPRFSGRVRVRFAGDPTHRAAGADAGVARVHPRLIVSITATRAANGSLENPHVHGRLVPAGGPVRVVWQARPAKGGAWLLFCRTADQLAVGRSGAIDGTCHVSGLNPGNRYRLVVLGDAGASYLPATTKAMVARPTS